MKRKQAEADKPEKKLRWDVPKTASLISFYKEHPELWNPRVPEYSNDKLRLKAVEAWLLENQLEPEKGNLEKSMVISEYDRISHVTC